jgi:PHS family inorganic phosphate transporter-like MFS transporter
MIPDDGRFPDGVNATPLVTEVLYTNMTHAIYTVSIASIVGSILMIGLINRQNRKTLLTATFIILAAILFAAFGSFTSLFHHEDTHVVLIIFWVVISVLFSFGPNFLTFCIPAEVSLS